MTPRLLCRAFSEVHGLKSLMMLRPTPLEQAGAAKIFKMLDQKDEALLLYKCPR